ncbi:MULTISPECIES: protein tyrosine phosphatase family protein [Sphingobium]|uniref:Protein tyrosine phosphatase family protein n=1 Tax=Sphingobium tyrosinilyticum TaxID=2715436 RepID=A0ABV9EUA7_9SPHN|nr:protein tyrosine phosphatase family protein [Sphingobium sp. EP60837]ANI77520.1 hypothetical protein EP837_01086 [Sphingobium sp. EP60837]
MAMNNGVYDPSGIFMWRRIDERLTTSGQPSEEQLAALAGLNVTHIVNLGLHSHDKALPDEAASVRALGMIYIHIPVPFDQPSESDFERFREVMAALADKTIHVHCIANLRVSAFLYRYRRDILHWEEAEARAEIERIWRPSDVWAEFIGDVSGATSPHRYAGRDY